MAIATILPTGRTQFTDANGVPLVSGYVYFYIPATSTLKNTWQDASQSTLNVNPVRLDSLGSALIYGYGQYRQKVLDSDGNTIWDCLTQDIMGLFTPQTSTTDGTAYIGYLQPGGTARSLYSKLLDYSFSVKDFGATGDGSTDDTTALQNALNHLNSAGGTLYFPAGKYRITSALSVTFTFSAVNDINRPSIRGDGPGNTQILWDGANTPATFMLTIQRTETVDGQGLHAHSVISGISFLPINSGKNQYISGLKLIKWAYLDIRDIWCHRLNYGMWADQVISAEFNSLNLRFNNYGFYGIGSPASSETGDIYANNALTFVGCVCGNNLIGGFESNDGSITYIGGSIESNGASGTAGSGYGAKFSNTGGGSPMVCNFLGTYFEANGTTGNLGANASTADIWIIHADAVDNLNWNVRGCNFNRLQNNYAPHCIYVNKSSTTAGSLTANGCTFTNYTSYSASASRQYIVINDTSGSAISVNIAALGNYYNQSTEKPTFIAGTTFYGGTTPSFINNKSFSALVYRAAAQTIATATPTAIIFDTTSYNDAGIFSGGAPTRLTVPAGVGRVRLVGNIRYAASAVDNAAFRLFIYKNGAAFAGIPYALTGSNAGTFGYTLNVSSGILNVSPADYFELMTQQNTGGNVDTGTDVNYATWMSLEIIE